MWGLFVGIIIGMLQVLGLSVFGKMVIGENSAARILGAFLLVVKIALVVFILILISTISLTHVIWAAGGIILGLIATFVFIYMRQKKKNTEDRKITGGKDSNNG